MANIFEQMSRSVSGMSKNASEVNNLRKKIAYERERIQEVMQEIGELYYESQEKELTKLKELCADIDDRKRRIQSMRLELQQMKGKRVCPGCGMQFDEKYQFAFCGKCGAKLDDPIAELVSMGIGFGFLHRIQKIKIAKL